MHNLDYIWFPKCQAHTVTSYPIHNSVIFIHLGQNSNTTVPTCELRKIGPLIRNFLLASALAHPTQPLTLQSRSPLKLPQNNCRKPCELRKTLDSQFPSCFSPCTPNSTSHSPISFSSQAAPEQLQKTLLFT